MLTRDILLVFLAVQHERGPRNSTLRRQQMAHFYTDPREALMLSSTASALNLALPKTDTGRSTVSPLLPPAAYMCNPSIAFPGVSSILYNMKIEFFSMSTYFIC